MAEAARWMADFMGNDLRHGVSSSHRVLNVPDTGRIRLRISSGVSLAPDKPVKRRRLTRVSWPIVATATVVGSTCSFITSRTLLSKFVSRLVAKDRRFEALSLVLKYDGLKLLVMIRLCPLPYSLSNGAISTFPTVQPWMFALATAIATPRLVIAVFIGSRLKAIAQSGEKMDTTTKAINWASIIFGVSLGAITGWLIYKRRDRKHGHLFE